jgi:hypothetical protein
MITQYFVHFFFIHLNLVSNHFGVYCLVAYLCPVPIRIVKLFLKQGIFRQQPWSWLKGFVRYECDNSAIFTPEETHVNQYLPLMKHMLNSIYR